MRMRTLAVVVVALLAVLGISRFYLGEDVAQVRALNDLLSWVYQNEAVNADIRWVLEAFERFDREKSWESLQIARATLEIAKRDIGRLALPKAEMTSADRAEFMRRGIDLSFMSGIDAVFKGEQISALNTCSNLSTGIMYDAFFGKDWKNCMRNVRFLEKSTDYEIQYLANTVDWVLTSMNDESARRKFSRLLEEHCPLTRAHLSIQALTPKEIEAVTHELMNQIEKLTVEWTQILGAGRDRVNEMKDALAGKDLSLFADDLVKISGLPDVVPSAEWFNYKDVLYYWQENGNIVASPRARTKLERIPDGFRIRISGVSLDEIKAYQKELRAECVASLMNEGTNTLICKSENSIFAITWENGTATILTLENPVCFVPSWLLSAQRSRGK